MAALGVAVAKFAGGGLDAVAAGLILILAGLLLSAYGTARYHAVARQLESGLFAPAGFGVIATATLVTVLALIAALILI
jgi:putative membrane protein